MATKRIAVLGGPRCGKTTLIQHLYVEMKIAGLNVGYAFEYSCQDLFVYSWSSFKSGGFVMLI